eukprot:14334166-Alexandrium_andersonii.AAC.1
MRERFPAEAGSAEPNHFQVPVLTPWPSSDSSRAMPAWDERWPMRSRMTSRSSAGIEPTISTSVMD